MTDSSTMVKHSTHHPKVDTLSPDVAAIGTKRQEMAKKFIQKVWPVAVVQWQVKGLSVVAANDTVRYKMANSLS